MGEVLNRFYPVLSAVGRSTGRTMGQKVKITVSLDPELYAWAVENSEPGGKFASVTHAIERALRVLREQEEE